MPAKACHDFNNDFTLFTAVPVLFSMYTDKDSNLISDLNSMLATMTKEGNLWRLCTCNQFVTVNFSRSLPLKCWLAARS